MLRCAKSCQNDDHFSSQVSDVSRELEALGSATDECTRVLGVFLDFTLRSRSELGPQAASQGDLGVELPARMSCSRRDSKALGVNWADSHE
jgi:hypothetical protein